jgi:hypothetical protein
MTNDAIIEPPPSRIETWCLKQEQFKETFKRVDPGTVIVYAVGDLGFSRQIVKDPAWADIEAVAELVYGMARNGEVELWQKRLGSHNYEYRAVKKR